MHQQPQQKCVSELKGRVQCWEGVSFPVYLFQCRGCYSLWYPYSPAQLLERGYPCHHVILTQAWPFLSAVILFEQLYKSCKHSQTKVRCFIILCSTFYGISSLLRESTGSLFLSVVVNATRAVIGDAKQRLAACLAWGTSGCDWWPLLSWTVLPFEEVPCEASLWTTAPREKEQTSWRGG